MSEGYRNRSDSLSANSLPLVDSLRDHVCAWYDHLYAVRGFSDHTLDAYFHDISVFVTFFAKWHDASLNTKHLAALDTPAIRAWQAHLVELGLSLRSRSRALASVRSFYRYLRKAVQLENDALFSFALTGKNNALPKALASHQTETLLSEDGALSFRQEEAWIIKRDYALFLLMYGCGLRISEALSLSRAAFSEGMQGLRITGKGKKQREVPLLKEVAEAIEAYLAICPHVTSSHEPFFLGLRGKPLQASIIQKKLRIIRVEKGLPETLTPHALRHSFATHLLAEGAGILDIQELLGHENISTTQIYTKIDARTLLSSYHNAHPSAKKS
jgi:integrase/recombinase XerC